MTIEPIYKRRLDNQDMKYADFKVKLQNSPYFKFIREKRKTEPSGYFESHHIYLRKFEEGKIDTVENLINLSLSDHILAHILLVKSLEEIGSKGKTYQIALAAANGMLGFNWQSLSDEEKDSVVAFLPNLEQEIATIRKKAIQNHIKLLRHKYGTANARMILPEAREKAKQTNLERYGNVGGVLTFENTKEASKQARVRKYGTCTAMLNTEEAKLQSLQTRKQRYGSYTAQCMTPEAREKVKQKQLEKYGKLAGQLHTPEVLEKRRISRLYTNKLRKKVFTSPEFIEWYKTVEHSGTKVSAVGIYLQQVGKKLEDFKDE